MDNNIKEILINESNDIDILIEKCDLFNNIRGTGEDLSYSWGGRYLTMEELKELKPLVDKVYDIIKLGEQRAWDDEDDIVQYDNINVNFEWGDTTCDAIVTDKDGQLITRKPLYPIIKL